MSSPLARLSDGVEWLLTAGIIYNGVAFASQLGMK
jgi:hypothetical protein